MNFETIKKNIIDCDNGMSYQNLNEMTDEVVDRILSHEDGEIFELETPYWTYTMKKETVFSRAVGKWWFRTKGPAWAAFERKCVESGLFEYTKHNNGLVCLYTTEENIEEAAKWIADKEPNLAKRNISYKFDIDTINGGKSKFKIDKYVDVEG